MSAERLGGSFGARTWQGLLSGALTYTTCALGFLYPSRTLFERTVNSKPSFFDSSYTRGIKLWPLPQRVTSFGWKPLQELWEVDGAAHVIKGGIWLYLNSYARFFLGRIVGDYTLQFYIGYFVGMNGFQPVVSDSTVSKVQWVGRNVACALLYPLESLCFRFRHNFDTAFRYSLFLSPSLIPWLLRQNLHDWLAQPVYQIMLRTYYPFLHFFLKREITEDRDTLKRIVGLRIFKAAVVISQQLLLCALLLPIDVIWAKAIGAECEGGANLIQIIQRTIEVEGIEGFYKGWQWYLLSNLDGAAEALWLPEVESSEKY